MTLVRAGVLAGVTVVAGVAALFGPPAVAVPAGLVLAFVVPGTALVGVLARAGLRVVERLVLVPALSLAALVLGGLGWWAVGGSLDRRGWTSLAVGVTLVAAGAAVVRDRVDPAGGREVPAERGSWVRALLRPEPAVLRRRLLRTVLPLALAAVLLTGAGWWSFADSERTYDVPVTTLAVAPPGPVGQDGNRQVRVTAAGLARSAGPYRLVLSGAEGEAITTRTVTPGTNGDWSGQLAVPGEERVTIGLFRAGESAAFRTVIIAAAQ